MDNSKKSNIPEQNTFTVFNVLDEDDFIRTLTRYKTVPLAEKPAILRSLAVEMQTFINSKDTISNLTVLKKYISILPDMQQRLRIINDLADKLKDEVDKITQEQKDDKDSRP